MQRPAEPPEKRSTGEEVKGEEGNSEEKGEYGGSGLYGRVPGTVPKGSYWYFSMWHEF